MAGLAKLGDKSRSKKGAQNANKTKRKNKSRENVYDRALRLKNEMSWPYNTLIDLSKLHKPTTKKGE